MESLIFKNMTWCVSDFRNHARIHPISSVRTWRPTGGGDEAESKRRLTSVVFKSLFLPLLAGHLSFRALEASYLRQRGPLRSPLLSDLEGSRPLCLLMSSHQGETWDRSPQPILGTKHVSLLLLWLFLHDERMGLPVFEAAQNSHHLGPRWRFLWSLLSLSTLPQWRPPSASFLSSLKFMQEAPPTCSCAVCSERTLHAPQSWRRPPCMPFPTCAIDLSPSRLRTVCIWFTITSPLLSTRPDTKQVPKKHLLNEEGFNGCRVHTSSLGCCSYQPLCSVLVTKQETPVRLASWSLWSVGWNPELYNCISTRNVIANSDQFYRKT